MFTSLEVLVSGQDAFGARTEQRDTKSCAEFPQSFGHCTSFLVALCQHCASLTISSFVLLGKRALRMTYQGRGFYPPVLQEQHEKAGMRAGELSPTFDTNSQNYCMPGISLSISSLITEISNNGTIMQLYFYPVQSTKASK